VFENRVLRRISAPKKVEVRGKWNCMVESFIVCSHPQISLGRSSQGECGGQGMWLACERRGKCTSFWWEAGRRDHLEDQTVNGRPGSKWILGRLAGRVCSGFTWLRIGPSDGLL
jgi:hypothetical protein